MKLFSLLAITGINGLHHHFGIQTGGSSQPQPAVQPPAPVMSNNNNMSSMGYKNFLFSGILCFISITTSDPDLRVHEILKKSLR